MLLLQEDGGGGAEGSGEEVETWGGKRGQQMTKPHCLGHSSQQADVPPPATADAQLPTLELQHDGVWLPACGHDDVAASALSWMTGAQAMGLTCQENSQGWEDRSGSWSCTGGAGGGAEGGGARQEDSLGSFSSGPWKLRSRIPRCRAPDSKQEPGAESRPGSPGGHSPSVWVGSHPQRSVSSPAGNPPWTQRAAAWVEEESDAVTSPPSACEEENRAFPRRRAPIYGPRDSAEINGDMDLGLFWGRKSHEPDALGCRFHQQHSCLSLSHQTLTVFCKAGERERPSLVFTSLSNQPIRKDYAAGRPLRESTLAQREGLAPRVPRAGAFTPAGPHCPAETTRRRGPRPSPRMTPLGTLPRKRASPKIEHSWWRACLACRRREAEASSVAREQSLEEGSSENNHKTFPRRERRVPAGRAISFRALQYPETLRPQSGGGPLTLWSDHCVSLPRLSHQLLPLIPESCTSLIGFILVSLQSLLRIPAIPIQPPVGAEGLGPHTFLIRAEQLRGVTEPPPLTMDSDPEQMGHAYRTGHQHRCWVRDKPCQRAECPTENTGVQYPSAPMSGHPISNKAGASGSERCNGGRRCSTQASQAGGAEVRPRKTLTEPWRGGCELSEVPAGGSQPAGRLTVAGTRPPRQGPRDTISSPPPRLSRQAHVPRG
ncbi:hypothetical protein Cadr_000027114 [Camelus dromedarius]|uniref:Uncharacterized protein n=1 Tax=Camelus dromedarius TaxID=9838 RepID=A0A5N4C4P6_CAMDR|nr:hypothetical protein Cadr_000027114 [Camelus dromedarius]